MFKEFIPFATTKSLFEISDDFFKKHHIKYVLCDLDNTLDNYKTKVPTLRVIEFKKRMDNLGIKMIIISNNHEPRVKKYADELHVSYLFKSKKPFCYKIKKYLEENHIPFEDSIFVGDQINCDVYMANKLNIRSILSEKISEVDVIITRFNRLFGNRIINYLRRHNKLISWREK